MRAGLLRHERPVLVHEPEGIVSRHDCFEPLRDQTLPRAGVYRKTDEIQVLTHRGMRLIKKEHHSGLIAHGERCSDVDPGHKYLIRTPPANIGYTSRPRHCWDGRCNRYPRTRIRRVLGVDEDGAGTVAAQIHLHRQLPALVLRPTAQRLLDPPRDEIVQLRR